VAQDNLEFANYTASTLIAEIVELKKQRDALLAECQELRRELADRDRTIDALKGKPS
jgi:uncharacterized coiled-coil DUF342 family protein